MQVALLHVLPTNRLNIAKSIDILDAVPSMVLTKTLTGPTALLVFSKRTSMEPASSVVLNDDDSTLTLTTEGKEKVEEEFYKNYIIIVSRCSTCQGGTSHTSEKLRVSALIYSH